MAQKNHVMIQTCMNGAALDLIKILRLQLNAMNLEAVPIRLIGVNVLEWMTSLQNMIEWCAIFLFWLTRKCILKNMNLN